MGVGRRYLTDIPRCAGRSWEDVAPQLEGWLKRIWESESDGIPSGFEENLPTTVEAGSEGAAGEGDTLGWAASDHEHPVATGAPGSLANSNVEGSSLSIPRLDHQHKRDLRVKEDGADVATRNALNFVNNAFVAWSATDDVGNDEVDLAAELGPSLETFTGTGTILNPGSLSLPINVIVWQAPFACDVTLVRGYRVGGTGAAVNARKNGASTHLASDLSLTSADTWLDGGAVQNESYTTGDKMELTITSVTTSPTQIAIQIYFNRT